MNFPKQLIAILALLPGLALAASGGHPLDQAPERASMVSLQNGAKLFVNHCLNCHAASSMRYNRLRDLGLTEDQIKALPTRDVKVSPSPATLKAGEIDIKGARSDGKDIYIDGIRVAGGVPPVEDLELLKIESGRGSIAELPVSGVVMFLKDAPKLDAESYEAKSRSTDDGDGPASGTPTGTDNGCAR